MRDNIIAEIKDPLVVDKSEKKPAFELERDADPEIGVEDVVLAPNEKALSDYQQLSFQTGFSEHDNGNHGTGKTVWTSLYQKSD